MTAAEIHALPGAELDRQIAEAIGLQIEWRYSGWYWPDRKEYAPFPAFSRDFNALLAVKERDGYDGPVAWLEATCTPRRLLAQVNALSMLHTSIRSIGIRGPRVLAESCLLAALAMREKEKKA